MIGVVDYGVGNMGSVLNMLKRVQVPARVVADEEGMRAARKLILPGVGAFDRAMSRLAESGLLELLNERVLRDGVPVLGLCLGMQLLTEGSEEGTLRGLGWIGGTTRRFRFDTDGDRLKIPHMGWNTVRPRAGAVLFQGLEGEAPFYFVHSYHVVCEREGDVAATARHGYDFTAAVQAGHIFGTQFHPEKSHRFGMRLLRNFGDL
jgi:imidazole glycerol-phosphate synthase subunit HisH